MSKPTTPRDPAFPSIKATKSDLKRLARIFGLKPNKKPPSPPPSRRGATWRRKNPNERDTDTAREKV